MKGNMATKKITQQLDLELRSPDWEDYALLDSGDGACLERFGPYTLMRPEAKAIWRRVLPGDAWDAAHARFEPQGKSGNGAWNVRTPVASPWEMQYKGLCFWARLTSSRHMGVFPENATHWDWIEEQLAAPFDGEPRVLNLFGYTGLATLAAARAGAHVTHVDAAQQAVRMARENQALSEMLDLPIRWIVDDALKFVRREVRRGVRYDGIVMDPPKFGRGPKGELWKFERLFEELCALCRDVLCDPPRFVVITAYAAEVTPAALAGALGTMVRRWGGSLTAGTLVTLERSAGRRLPNACFARWNREA
jgi:23S rRNA (cytosine1962-C5)-methyltransferase